MAFGNNPFDVLREEDEEEAICDADCEDSPAKSMSSARQIIAHWRCKSSAGCPLSMTSPSRPKDETKSSSTSRPLSPMAPSRPISETNRQSSITSMSQFMNDPSRRKSIPSQPINESGIYNRGIKSEAKICKVHFTAWRRNLHRGCEEKACTLHHDPRDWPVWCIEMVPSGPMRELLEIQRDIDVVRGKGAFEVDTALARIKSSITSPPRARNRQNDTKNSMREVDELSPEELVAKGRRIQQMWDDSLRLYRLRKERPEEVASGYPNLQYHPAANRPRPVSFFGDDDPEGHNSNPY